ncbi:Uncharacterised protein g2700 [Pycnogonum litorale]
MFLPSLSPKRSSPVLTSCTSQDESIETTDTRLSSCRSSQRDLTDNGLLPDADILLPGSVCDEQENSMTNQEKCCAHEERSLRKHEATDREPKVGRNSTSNIYTIVEQSRNAADNGSGRTSNGNLATAKSTKQKRLDFKNSRSSESTEVTYADPLARSYEQENGNVGANITGRLHRKYFIEERERQRFFIDSLCQKEMTLNCFAKLVTGLILVAVLVLFIVTLYRLVT